MASRSLGSLTLDLVLRLGGFQQGANRAVREVDRLSERFTTAGRAATRALGLFGVGFSVVGITRGLTEAAKAAIEFGDEVQKATAKTGIGAEAFSELAFAAKQSDIEIDALGTAFKKMQTTLSEAGSGTKAAQETFRALGLELEQLRALKPDQQFEVLADRINALKDPADRTRAAVELFGRAGADLLPLFEDGAAGIRRAREEAQRLGATLTGEQAAALAEADEQIKRLTAAYEGFTRSATAVIATPLADFFDGVNTAIGNQAPLLDRLTLTTQAYFKAIADGEGFWDTLFTNVADVSRAYKELTDDATRAAKAQADLTGSGLPPGSRRPFVPGFEPSAIEAALRGAQQIDRAARDGLAELAIDTQQITVSATEQLYREMDVATQTSMQRQLAEWEKFDSQVQALVSAGRITPEDAFARMSEKTDEFLQELEITTERITLPVEEANEEVTAFLDEAQRATQRIGAQFLESFDLKTLVQDFDDAFKQIAANAVSARIAEKLFSGMDGILDKLGGLFSGAGGGGFSFGSFFGGIADFFGFAEGGRVSGPGHATSDTIPAWLSPGEFVVNARSVAIPGALRLLEQLNDGRLPVQKFAVGGLVGDLSSGRIAPELLLTGQMENVNRKEDGGDTFNVAVSFHAPTGTVSRQTAMQVGNDIARQLQIARARNG
jgi:hypothetical protein